ncbi:MAG: 4Fe-4S dicluster domain-containing protein [Lachnospiraceae bacterium]|nr:4Fe-4S dicluster domain-containing protein [Lachnospiraceae bacterium]
MGTVFPELKGIMGFGTLRLPLIEEGVVDIEETKRMVDHFLKNGFNYFDTSHNYIGGASERAVKECLTDRYPRDQYVLGNKLSRAYFNCKEDIRPLFESQLEICGVDYFDFYLMHSQNLQRYQKFKSQGAYDTAIELKKEGKIRHFGISFHDKADVLELILNDYPEIEVVQIQFNYVDYDSASVESRKVYDVCRKHNKAVFIMEPLRGGCLVNHLPEAAAEEFKKLGDQSPASYALRFPGNFEGVEMILSGSSTYEQIAENVATMKEYQPLSEKEMETVFKVKELFKAQDMIACTACRYCVEGCPKNILIPDIFACLNAETSFTSWKWSTEIYYHESLTINGNKASDCIGCGQCEANCPQGLPIRELLKVAVAEFEEKERAVVK